MLREGYFTRASTPLLPTYPPSASRLRKPPSGLIPLPLVTVPTQQTEFLAYGPDTTSAILSGVLHRGGVEREWFAEDAKD